MQTQTQRPVGPGLRARGRLGLGLACLCLCALACGDVGEPAAVNKEGQQALGSERSLSVKAPVELHLVGLPRMNELRYTFKGTVTASTSEAATQLADSLKVEVALAGEQASLTLETPPGASLRGVLRVELPEDLAVSAVASGPGLWVRQVKGALTLRAASHTRVEGAAASADIEVSAGNAILGSSLPAGSQTKVVVGAGSIQLKTPAVPSVQLQAETGSGRVLIRNTALPSAASTARTYTAAVHGGLAGVRLKTGRGNILITGDGP